MKAQDYRDLTDALSDRLASFRSAATSHERRCEAEHLRRAHKELAEATPSRWQRVYDVRRADTLLRSVQVVLDAHDLACQQADVALIQRAFGGEYR